MSKPGKNTVAADAKVDRQKLYSTEEAIQVMRDAAFAKFDETVELHARLGIDPRQADQAVRSTVTLPHGTGSTVRVLVFAQGEAAHIAEEAGADFVGADDLVAKISDAGSISMPLATADMMGKVGSLGGCSVAAVSCRIPAWHGRSIARRLPVVIKDLKGGRVEFVTITSVSSTRYRHETIHRPELRDIARLVEHSIARTVGVKGVYLKSLSLTSTMGPGIRLDVGKAMAEAEGIGR